MNIDELYATVDRSTAFYIAVYGDDGIERASYYSRSNTKIFFNNLTKIEIALDTLSEVIDHLKNDFSAGSKRFKVAIALKDSSVDASFDSTDAIANLCVSYSDPIRTEKDVIVSVAKLLAETLKVEFPGPILTRTKIVEPIKAYSSR